MTNTVFSELQTLFMPKSIAVIGASNDTAKFGGIYLKNLLQFGYTGKVFPVNPNEETIQGLAAYKDINEVPGEIDLAVITTPGKFVLPAVKSCARKGVKGVQIMSAGFRESGDAGTETEAKLVAVSKEYNMRLVGPNCFGIYCPDGGMTIIPGLNFPRESGPVGLISQSGGGACDIVNMGKGRGTRFSVLVSYGNGCDVDAVDLLRYFEQDDGTRVVGAYLEGVKDGTAFFNALKACAAKKPVIIHKGGLTDQGRRGTVGHTGSMAGSRSTWEAVIKSAGAVPAKDLKDLGDCLMAFQLLEGFTENSAGVLAGGGLRCVEALDAASNYGFEIPEPDGRTLVEMASLLPPSGGVAGNPVDLARPSLPPSGVIPVMNLMAGMASIRFLVLYQNLYYPLSNYFEALEANKSMEQGMAEYHREVVPAAQKIFGRTGKRLVVVMPELVSDRADIEIEKGILAAREFYAEQGIPCFETGNQAFSVLRRVVDYYRCRRDRLT